MQIMPLVFTFFFFLFPSGLVLYWLTNTVLGDPAAVADQQARRARGGAELAAAPANIAREQPGATQRDDTIAALATAPGTGAVAIVRLSGPDARAIGAIVGCEVRGRATPSCARFATPTARRSTAASSCSSPAPRSYTGEDVVELHGHGGRIVSDALLARAYALGARPAEPGEFTLRAFLNDKLDLLQAEAVADLVASGSAARGARRVALARRPVLGASRGAASGAHPATREDRSVARLSGGGDSLRRGRANARRRSTRCSPTLAALATRARSGAMLRDGLTVAIAGPPNAGKSSLLNRLAGYDAAIVTDIPGTTRDPLREHLIARRLGRHDRRHGGPARVGGSGRARRIAPCAARGRSCGSCALGRRRARAARRRARGGARRSLGRHAVHAAA